MRVILKSEIFASQEINQLKLMSLIQLGEKRHLIQIKPRNSNEEREWLDKQAQEVREACEHVFRLGIV
jgi:hypothetical protein